MFPMMMPLQYSIAFMWFTLLVFVFINYCWIEFFF